MVSSTRSRIEALLLDEGLQPGDRLPAERSLAERLEQSRAAVRKVLDQFESEGRVERHVGRGTFLIQPPVDGSDSMSPRDVMTVRRLLEPAVARRIVAEATPADVAEIRRCMERCESAESYRDFEHWDGASHRAMIQAAHSPLLSRMYQIVDQARSGALWGELKQRSAGPETVESYMEDHRRILEAIVNRDPDGAERATLAHVENVTKRLFG